MDSFLMTLLLKVLHIRQFYEEATPQNSMTSHTHKTKYVNTQRHMCTQKNCTQMETVFTCRWLFFFVFSTVSNLHVVVLCVETTKNGCRMAEYLGTMFRNWQVQTNHSLASALPAARLTTPVPFVAL